LKVIDFDTSRKPLCNTLANNMKLHHFCRLLVDIFYIFILLLLLLFFSLFTPDSIGPRFKNKEKDQKQMWNG